MKYPVVATLTGQGLSVARVCKLLGLSRSGFYDWVNRLTSPSDQEIRRRELAVMIRKIHADSRCVYGSRRVHAELTMGLGIQVSKPMVEKIMRSNNIYGLPTKRKYRKKTNLATASDLVNRNFGRSQPNQLWVTDITQHPTKEGVLYCAAVLDTNARKVVGWSIDSNQTSKLVIDAIDMAINHRSPEATIIHSDHGSQFVSWAFSQRVKAAGLTPSMGSIGDGYDNAPMESFWGRMQTELLNTKTWSTRAELASAIFSYIEIFHNRQRRHSALGYRTPVEYENLQTQATAVA
ncbi:IS2 transposase TnpB [mine drainage metagenome]|uniref:IS2 transposase TnpB n=1 Tax=mine drainage metagenome TaxID=410659 RepID=A0A1J5QR23_9ZZZZ